MKKEEATLYYGDNGVHEFWETPKGSKPSVLMYRNHQEKYWTANVNGLLLEEPLNTQDIKRHIFLKLAAAKTAEDMVKLIEKREGIKLTLSRDRKWVLNPRTKDGFPMVLK